MECDDEHLATGINKVPLSWHFPTVNLNMSPEKMHLTTFVSVGAGQRVQVEWPFFMRPHPSGRLRVRDTMTTQRQQKLAETCSPPFIRSAVDLLGLIGNHPCHHRFSGWSESASQVTIV